MQLLDKFWSGSADTYNAVNFALAKQSEFKSLQSADTPQLPPIWDKQDGVAIIDISGSLISGDSGWMRMYGVLGYDNIQAALVQAVTDPEVKSIMLHISSGGGAVTGVDDLAAFIKRIDTLKPVVTFAAGTMASAAYWLGSSGRYIMSSQTSIGVVLVLSWYILSIAKQIKMQV
jgi:ClpP class serine protease